jgi:hypothetical protein
MLAHSMAPGSTFLCRKFGVKMASDIGIVRSVVDVEGDKKEDGEEEVSLCSLAPHLYTLVYHDYC